MKVRMAVLAASVLGLAACATTGEQTATGHTPVQQQARTVETDTEYMARVEAVARRRGIGLTWVNPPRKIVAKDD